MLFRSTSNLQGFCDGAYKVAMAADVAGLSLFAGLRAEAIPEDLPARTLHLMALLREMRGSMHLIALISEGVVPRYAHYAKRPDEYALFGWDEKNPPVITEEIRAAIARVEDRTDDLCCGPYGVLNTAVAGRILPSEAKSWCPIAMAPDLMPSTISPTPPNWELG